MLTLQTGTSTDQSGFTLVELLVVVVVLGLITTISLPLLSDRGDGAEKQILRRVAGTVKQLYNEATLTRDQFLVTFDLDQNKLEAYRLTTKAGAVDKESFGKVIDLMPLRIRQVAVAGQGSFQTGRVSVKIYPLGWMDAAEIDFEREDGRGVNLTFSPLTGTPTINEERSHL